MDSYDGRAVANYVLDFCERKGLSVTNLSLQKIVYFCHVWSLIDLGKPLIKHKFEAWAFGPVLPYLYREFRSYDRASITGRSTQLDLQDGSQRIVPYDFDLETKSLLSRVVGFYGRMRAGDLVELSHVAGGPWHTVWNHEGLVNPGMKIDEADIVSFYSKVPGPFSIQ